MHILTKAVVQSEGKKEYKKKEVRENYKEMTLCDLPLPTANRSEEL